MKWNADTLNADGDVDNNDNGFINGGLILQFQPNQFISDTVMITTLGEPINEVPYNDTTRQMIQVVILP